MREEEMVSSAAEIDLRTMCDADIPVAMRLKQIAGWNQTWTDFRRFLSLEPGGGLVAVHDSQVVGTVIAFSFPPIAWIAMMLVDPAWRRQGIATRLMQASIERLDRDGIPGVYLDATELGAPVYQRIGFCEQAELVRFGGRVRGWSCDRSASICVRDFRWEDLSSLVALDRNAVGADRSGLLKRLLVERFGAARVALQRGQVRGYALDRPGSRARFLGPLVAETEQAGRALMADSLLRFHGQQVMVDIPTSNSVGQTLARAAGLSPQRKFLRMVRGVAAAAQQGWLWASSGPEKG